MARLIDGDAVMERIEQTYKDMGVDTHGIWNKQLAEILHSADVEEVREFLHSILGAITQSPTIDAVEALPSADRPQGRWIYDHYDSRGVNRCSECGAEIKGYGENIPFPNCPYCLARMKGADDE